MALNANVLRDDIVTRLFPDFSNYDSNTQNQIRDIWGNVAEAFIDHFINNAEITTDLASNVVNRIDNSPSEDTFEIDNLEATGSITA